MEHLFSDAFWQEETPRFLSPDSSFFTDHRLPITDHFLFQTSGSTGKPKWIALSKRALMISAAAVNRHLEVTSASRWGLALPVHHVGGFGVIARAREASCTLRCFPGRWDPHAFSRWIADEEITHTSLVPTQVHDLVTAEAKAPPCIRAIVVGGGELRLPTGHAARHLGWPVLASYGMTEASSQIATQPLTALTTPFASHPLPLLPHWHAEEETNGRLRLSGDALFSGTWTEETGYQPRQEIWYSTPDLVHLTPAGLIPLGRADETVKILGELVNPATIEREFLTRHPEWAGNLVVIAIPDERRGHRLVPACDARISLVSLSSAISSYNARLSGPLRLDPPFPLSPFPRSPLGKPLRPEIAATITDR